MSALRSRRHNSRRQSPAAAVSKKGRKLRATRMELPGVYSPSNNSVSTVPYRAPSSRSKIWECTNFGSNADTRHAKGRLAVVR